MPETLQVTQTPAPAQVNTPSIVANLNTDTGPQASPQAFGPDLNGLAQGLDQANQDVQQTLYRSRFERRETQQAQNELWALNQHANLDKQWTGTFMQNEAKGQPMNPQDFDTQFSKQVSDIAANAPNDMARASFMAKASSLQLGFYKQNLASISRVQQQDRQVQASNVIGEYVSAAQNGSLSPQDAIAGIQSVGHTVAPAVDGMPGIVSQAQGQVIQSGIQNLAASHGPGVASLAVRGGFGGQAIPPTQRELLATQLDNQQDINQEARKSVAQQNVNALANKAAAGGFVSNQDAHTAATALADATTAQPVNTNPPDLVDFVRGRVDELHSLGSQITGEYAEAQLRGIQQIETRNVSKVVEQRLNLMTPDQQRTQVSGLADAFGEDDPLVRHAARIAGDNIEMLTPGTPKYDPAAYAMKNPAVVTALASAQDAMQNAGNPADQGKAQGQMKTAIEQSFAAQRIVGIPAGQEQVLTHNQAEAYSGAADDPKQAKQMVNQMQSLYGPEYSTRAIQQVFTQKGKINGAVQMALLNPDSQKVWAAAQFQPEKTDPKDETVTTINSAMSSNPDWKNFWASQSDDYGAAQRRTLMEKAMPGMAQYYMQQFNMSPDVAAKAVIGDTINKAYTITPGGNGTQLSLPTTAAPTTQDAHALVDKANLALATLLQQNKLQTGPIQDQTHLQIQALQSGHWAWSAKTGGLMRMYDSANGVNAVKLDDGQSVSFSLDGLKSANTVRQMSVGPHPDQDDGGEREAFGSPGSPAYRIDADPKSLLIPDVPKPDNSPILSMPGKDGSDPSFFLNYIKGHPQSTSMIDKLPDSMKGLAPYFAKYGQQYGIDPALLAAISMHETGQGTSRAYLKGNNAMGVSNSAGPLNFTSPEDSIEHQAQMLSTSPFYSQWRQSGDIDDLGAAYAPVGAENDPGHLNKDWVGGVSKFYKQIKG